MNVFPMLGIYQLFWRRSHGDRDNRLVAVLPIASFAVVTALLLIVIGGSRALIHLNAGMFLFPTAIALALLVIPLVTLGTAAAKLAARRRDARLSSLRLLGATNSQVTGITVLEAAGNALIGAVLGTGLYALLVPLVGLVRFAGAPLGRSLWLPFGWLPLVWVLLAALGAASAAFSLRSVLITPLGVRMRTTAKRVSGKRGLLALVLVLIGIAAATSMMGFAQAAGALGIVIGLVLVFGCGLLALDAIGPWYLRVRARGSARKAKTVERLLAARMTLDDPLSAWRQVSGLAVTTFVGVVAGAGLGLFAIAGSGAGGDPTADNFVGDWSTGIYLTLVIAFVMVASTVAINQAAAMLDRARVQVSLDRLGVPRPMLARAARLAVMRNVMAVVLGSGLVSAALILPMLGATVLMNPTAIITMLAVFTGGVLVVRLGASVAGSLVPGILARPDRVL